MLAGPGIGGGLMSFIVEWACIFIIFPVLTSHMTMTVKCTQVKNVTEFEGFLLTPTACLPSILTGPAEKSDLLNEVLSIKTCHMKNKNRIWFIPFAIMGLILLLPNGCKKEQVSIAPSLTTALVSDIAQTTATSGGAVTSDGGAAITARGVCW